MRIISSAKSAARSRNENFIVADPAKVDLQDAIIENFGLPLHVMAYASG